jgi:hypothetical protein
MAVIAIVIIPYMYHQQGELAARVKGFKPLEQSGNYTCSLL